MGETEIARSSEEHFEEGDGEFEDFDEEDEEEEEEENVWRSEIHPDEEQPEYMEEALEEEEDEMVREDVGSVVEDDFNSMNEHDEYSSYSDSMMSSSSRGVMFALPQEEADIHQHAPEDHLHPPSVRNHAGSESSEEELEFEMREYEDSEGEEDSEAWYSEEEMDDFGEDEDDHELFSRGPAQRRNALVSGQLGVSGAAVSGASRRVGGGVVDAVRWTISDISFSGSQFLEVSWGKSAAATRAEWLRSRLEQLPQQQEEEQLDDAGPTEDASEEEDDVSEDHEEEERSNDEYPRAVERVAREEGLTARELVRMTGIDVEILAQLPEEFQTEALVEALAAVDRGDEEEEEEESVRGVNAVVVGRRGATVNVFTPGGGVNADERLILEMINGMTTNEPVFRDNELPTIINATPPPPP
jgi:hypothetical protein